MEPVELPDFARLRLDKDPATGGYFLRHLDTGESVALPGTGKQWHLVEAGGGFGCLRNGEQETWAINWLGVRVISDNETGRLFVVLPSGEVQRWQDYRTMHRRRTVQFPIGGDTKDFQVYRFMAPWSGASIWWSWDSFYRAAAIETSQRPGHWLHSHLPSWEKALDAVNLTTPHLRRAAVTKASSELPADMGLRARTLPETTMSTFAILHILVRLAKPAANLHSTSASSARNCIRWKLVLFSITSLMYDQTTKFHLYHDTQVSCNPEAPMCGRRPFDVLVVRGKVQLTDYDESDERPPPEWLVRKDGQDLVDLLVHLASVGKRAAYLLKQFVFRTAREIEQKIEYIVDGATATDSSSPAGRSVKLKCLSRLAKSLRIRLLDGDSVLADCSKYYYASRQHMSSAGAFSVAVDASRLGKRGYLLGCMVTANNKAMWMPPQASAHERCAGLGA